MDLINGALSIIGVFIVGFVGNILAHDFCECAPALARWLLAIATKWLHPTDRARYAEEWAAHLIDREGVYAKLSHAFGCLWCARRMRKQTFKSITLSVTFNFRTIGQAVVETNLYEASVLLWLYRLFARTKPTGYAYAGACILLFLHRVFVDTHERSGVNGGQFVSFIHTIRSEDWTPTDITLTLEGQRVELIELLRGVGNSLIAFAAKLASALNVEVEPPERKPKNDRPVTI